MNKAYGFEISCTETQTTFFKKIDKLRDKKIKYIDLNSNLITETYTPEGEKIDVDHYNTLSFTFIESGTTNKIIDCASSYLFNPFSYLYNNKRILINKKIDWEQSFITDTTITTTPKKFILYFVVWYEDENIFNDSFVKENVKYYPLECTFKNGLNIDKMYFSENQVLKNAKKIVNIFLGQNEKTPLTYKENAISEGGTSMYLNLSYKNDLFLYNVPIIFFSPQSVYYNMKEINFSNMKFDVTESYILIPRNLLKTSWGNFGMFFNIGYID